MLLKKPVAGRKVEVTFRMPPLDDVVELSLSGDFNNWNIKGVPLSQDTDGTWFATIVLDAGKSYRFRYCDNQGRWHNDWEADAYVPNEFGSEDSVLDLTAAKKPVAAKKPATTRSKTAAPKKAGRGSQAKGKR
jgi:1,4-alpha-glucan branching enzyme